MISNKHIAKIGVFLILVILIACVVAMAFKEKISDIAGETKYNLQYETKIFDTSKVVELDIIIDEADFNEMLNNAMAEEYQRCDIVINGEKFYNVGIRPKGNTSLSSIAKDADNNRYSFKVEFDRFVEGQTCFGLDKLALNNNYADVTNMKEAVIYDMYQFVGADAPLYNYAKISVNGKYWGVYLAVEAVEDSFMQRRYAMEKGFLYQPDNMNMGKKEDGTMPSFGGGRGNGGADLNYTDDDLASYDAIWNGAVTKSSDADHKRVVQALKNISEGKDIEKYFDVDNLLKYMAVHTFSVNDDSLSGHMAHNYYLYESGGRLNIIPWDYNLAFGGMGRGNGSAVINSPIDSPFSITEFFNPLLENEAYKEKYHQVFNELIEKYIKSGKFEETYNRIRGQIDALVKDDPNAMHEYEEYLKGADMLFKTVMLRTESISGQIKGEIPSTSEGQKENSTALLDASEIDTSAMGSMMGGRRTSMEEREENPLGMTRGGQFTEDEMTQRGNVDSEKFNEMMPPERQGLTRPTEGEGFPQAPMGERGGFGNFGNRNIQNTPMTFESFVKEYSTPIISLVLLGGAYLFVIFYKRKRY